MAGRDPTGHIDQAAVVFSSGEDLISGRREVSFVGGALQEYAIRWCRLQFGQVLLDIALGAAQTGFFRRSRQQDDLGALGTEASAVSGLMQTPARSINNGDAGHVIHSAGNKPVTVEEQEKGGQRTESRHD